MKGLSENKIIKVKDTFSSLNNMAKITRDRTIAQIIGIPGSAGKTTIKNLETKLEKYSYWKERFEQYNLSPEHLKTQSFNINNIN